MQIRMSTGDALPRRAWTEGLEALGQQELGVTLPWPQGDARDTQITRLLRFIEGYISSQPRRILAGQTMKYGWSRLRFVADEQENRLLIEELSNLASRHTCRARLARWRWWRCKKRCCGVCALRVYLSILIAQVRLLFASV